MLLRKLMYLMDEVLNGNKIRLRRLCSMLSAIPNGNGPMLELF